MSDKEYTISLPIKSDWSINYDIKQIRLKIQDCTSQLHADNVQLLESIAQTSQSLHSNLTDIVTTEIQLS